MIFAYVYLLDVWYHIYIHEYYIYTIRIWEVMASHLSSNFLGSQNYWTSTYHTFLVGTEFVMLSPKPSRTSKNHSHTPHTLMMLDPPVISGWIKGKFHRSLLNLALFGNESYHQHNIKHTKHMLKSSFPVGFPSKQWNFGQEPRGSQLLSAVERLTVTRRSQLNDGRCTWLFIAFCYIL